VRAENLQEVIRAVPFRPFALVVADGSQVVVHHPEWIAYGGGRTAIVLEPDDRTHFIDVMLVTRLELDPPVPAGSIAPNPNGGE
jgi:hypothetical protein